MMWPVETPVDMKNTILRNKQLPERTPIIRIWRTNFLLCSRQVMPLRVFWLSNDEHVRAMFASHGRILLDQVMQLYVQLLETQTATPGVGPSHSGPAGDTPMAADLVYIVSPGNKLERSLSLKESHFHMLHQIAIEEERLTDTGALQHFVLGTIVDIQAKLLSEGRFEENTVQFDKVFWAFPPCIEAFKVQRVMVVLSAKLEVARRSTVRHKQSGPHLRRVMELGDLDIAPGRGLKIESHNDQHIRIHQRCLEGHKVWVRKEREAHSQLVAGQCGRSICMGQLRKSQESLQFMRITQCDRKTSVFLVEDSGLERRAHVVDPIFTVTNLFKVYEMEFLPTRIRIYGQNG
ncbi:hypothetical protein PIB30_057128 [Stylosanthes scabra]|uniref:Uncharacterized protein n=1 Tax=Stylosanthes scabra TaxID=79078 RepID=A0ABU6SJP1_9FABA|nr:hypothetical protein [Stylosanthes scabra]